MPAAKREDSVSVSLTLISPRGWIATEVGKPHRAGEVTGGIPRIVRRKRFALAALERQREIDRRVTDLGFGARAPHDILETGRLLHRAGQENPRRDQRRPHVEFLVEPDLGSELGEHPG